MRYLITGITGTLGQAVTKLILKNENDTVVGVSRDEQKQRALPSHPRLELLLGDVRDRNRMIEVSFQVDKIFHFAALKCVDSLESQPGECLKTNVLGTQNIIDAQNYHRIKRVILSATDKGAYPINVYGNSKAMAERLVLQNPDNVVCRYGNVLASRGSVVPMFVKSLKEHRTAYITHPEMTRFLIRIENAAAFVYEKSFDKEGGLKVPEMKGTNMIKLAEAIADILKIPNWKWETTGIRPGEKIHECLRMSHEGKEVHSNTAEQFTQEELAVLLKPIVESLV